MECKCNKIYILIEIFNQVVHPISHNHLLPLPQYIPKEAFFLQRDIANFSGHGAPVAIQRFVVG